MLIKPEHRLTFACDDNIPDILNPVHIPKDGDKIKVIGKWNGEKFDETYSRTYEVTEVKYELSILSEEQTIVVYLI